MLLSQKPLLARLRHALSLEECGKLRRALLDAVVFFNSSGANVTSYAEFQSPFAAVRPVYRMQNERHLTVFFPHPTATMEVLYKRVAAVLGVPHYNVEAVYHLYAPGAPFANLHLDNFNAALHPHRLYSFTVFLDHMEDGGTVFPLLLKGMNGDDIPASPAAMEENEVDRWQDLLNRSFARQRDGGYAFRILDTENFGRDEKEWHAFARRTVDAARVLCDGGAYTQFPVVPERGTAYMWSNYKTSGEDDVRTIHAGCGSSRSFKMIVTIWIRDAAGPFVEQEAFWDPLDESGGQDFFGLQRRMEQQQLQDFRLYFLQQLYHLQREATFDVEGPEAAERETQAQQQHLWHLQTDPAVWSHQGKQEKLREDLGGYRFFAKKFRAKPHPA